MVFRVLWHVFGDFIAGRRTNKELGRLPSIWGGDRPLVSIFIRKTHDLLPIASVIFLGGGGGGRGGGRAGAAGKNPPPPPTSPLDISMGLQVADGPTPSGIKTFYGGVHATRHDDAR